MLGFGKKGRAEQQLADWLAHPLEFGERPKSVRHKKTYRARLITHGDVAIDLVDYVMVDGTAGRGFVNGALTWSFLGDEVGAISDDDLLVAYCGWAWLFPALQAGSVETAFESAEEEEQFRKQTVSAGVTEFAITARYRIGTSELFEYTGVLHGKRVRGAGNTEDAVAFGEGEANFGLPSIYFLLGRVAIQSLK